MDNLHEALKTEQVGQATVASVHYLLIRLQHSKTDSLLTIHANPTSWTSYGAQTTDLLALLGFHRAPCHFFRGECYARTVSEGFRLESFALSFAGAYTSLCDAEKRLERCGFIIPKPEGYGFFHHQPPQRQLPNYPAPVSNGHVAPETNQLKKAEDAVFNYVLSWIAGRDKGWTTHFRPKHPPLSHEIRAAFDFLEGFRSFDQCPEFDFEPCLWRFWPSDSSGRAFDGRAGSVHNAFDALVVDFTPGIELLLKTHAAAASYGMGFLSISEDVSAAPPRQTHEARPPRTQESCRRYKYDVALSFAGTERPLAEELAKILRDKGVEVFYDDFYEEQLWGKDLASHFDRIYRKESRFCVIFVSNEYKNRIWPSTERQSAVARSIESTGVEYILPIRVEDADLDGIPPTIGYVDARHVSIQDIAERLLKKLALQS